MSNTTNTPDAPQQVIYVERAPEPKNGLAIAALLIGVVGLVFSLIPLTGWLAIMAGVTATVLGLVAWNRKRKGRATAGKTAIAATIAGVLAMIVGVIGMVIFFNAVDDLSTSIDNMTADTKPVAVTEGAAFTHDGYTADAGWTIKGEFGDPTIKGLTVTNTDHKSSIDNSTTDTPMFTFRLYNGNKTVGEVDCTGNEIAKGESSSMDCLSLGSGKWTTYDTVKVDDTFGVDRLS